MSHKGVLEASGSFSASPRISRIVGKAESLRDGYLDALAALRENLSVTARRLGWSFTWHRTDHSPHLALRALYEVMAGNLV